MPDPKNKQAEEKESEASKEGYTDKLSEADQLRQELGVFKDKFELTQQELEDFRNRYDEREDQFRRDFSRQGQELGERVKQLRDLIGRVTQPTEEAQGGKKKRPAVIQIPDNINEQEKFIEFQQVLVEQVRELQDEIEQLQSIGGQVNSLKAEHKKMQEDLNLARYETLLTKEETDLREKYGLSDRDLRKVRDYMQTSGIYSMEAAAAKTPGLDKEKMYAHYLKQGQNGGMSGQESDEEEDQDPRPKKKSRYNAKQVGEEILKTKSDDTIPKGGAKRTEGEAAWLEEMNQAVLDNSFFSWPKQKQEEYENRLKQFHNSQEPPRRF